jgi:hypothetical protein
MAGKPVISELKLLERSDLHTTIPEISSEGESRQLADPSDFGRMWICISYCPVPATHLVTDQAHS